MTSPCKDCPDRSPTCHGNCESYKTYAREREQIRDTRRKNTSFFVGRPWYKALHKRKIGEKK